jgi:hypothetical protein
LLKTVNFLKVRSRIRYWIREKTIAPGPDPIRLKYSRSHLTKTSGRRKTGGGEGKEEEEADTTLGVIERSTELASLHKTQGVGSVVTELRDGKRGYIEQRQVRGRNEEVNRGMKTRRDT